MTRVEFRSELKIKLEEQGLKLSNDQVRCVIDTFEEVVAETLVKGDDVNLTGFVKFEVKDTKPRQGRNPKTGESIEIPAGVRASAKIGKSLKDRIKASV